MPFIGVIDPFDPDILASDESLRPLYWPEGEKDTDTVSGKGELAFTFGGVGDGLPAVARAGRQGDRTMSVFTS